MTKKHIAITMAMVMGISMMAGCSSSTGSSSEATTAVVSEQTQNSESIRGEVESSSDDSITVD